MAQQRRGLSLCQGFSTDQVAPTLAMLDPGLAHAAAVLGRGSEVLGFDDAMSTDHDWTARSSVFLPAALGEEEITSIGVEWVAYDWVTLPEHRLCAVTSGEVFHDEGRAGAAPEPAGLVPGVTSGFT